MENKTARESVIYQIYPPSFMDSNNDGWGDLNGIASRIPYLHQLGIDTIWLGPIYDSPMIDNGYDIRDYYQIDTKYGTMEQFESLLDQLHDIDMKLIMDLVINHTSDEHPWFQQSKSAKDNPYRDYYIWRPAKSDGAEPNNWRSFQSESAWTYDEQTDEYYLHLFDRKQPDLNWEHPPLRQEVYKMIRWWLDKGIDGFRLDAINMISKHPDLPDAAEDDPHPIGQRFYKNGPRIHEFLQELHRETFAHYPHILTIGEAPSLTMEQVLEYTLPERKELNMVLAMDMMRIGKDPHNPWGSADWSVSQLKESVSKWYEHIFARGEYGVYLSTHDHPRMIPDVIGHHEHNMTAAKLVATFLHLIPGVPLVYQGEELGLPNTTYDRIEDYRDQGTIHYYKEAVQDGKPAQEVLAGIHQRSRDGSRSPMPWDAHSENFGFSPSDSTKPWIPFPDKESLTHLSVSEQEEQRGSVLSYYRHLIAMRKQFPIMSHGSFTMLLEDHPEVFAFIREWQGQRWLILLNFADVEAEIDWTQEYRVFPTSMVKILGNYPHTAHPPHPEEEQHIDDLQYLRPYEVLIYRM